MKGKWTLITKQDWSKLKPGDSVTRMLAGTIPMQLRVIKVEDGIIHTGGGWTFLVLNGCEVDAECGWDGITNTGSFLVKEALN